MSSSTWTPDKIVLAPTSTLGFEGSPTVTVPNGIEMHGALLAFTDAAPKGSTSIHVVEGDNNMRIGRGSNATFTTPVTVDADATLKLIQMDGSGANYTDKIWTFASVVTNNGTFSINTMRHIISSTGFHNNGTLTVGVDNCMFSNIVFTAAGTVNAAGRRMQFYGTFACTNEDMTMVSTSRGIDFHSSTVTLKGKTLTLAPVGTDWFGGGPKQLVADGPVVLSPTEGADIRAFATDFPVAPSITLNIPSSKALTFQTNGRFADPTNAPRTAYLNGGCYVLPATSYSAATFYNFLDYHQDVRTVITNADWNLANASSGLHLGTTSTEADVALGTNAKIETSLVQFQSAPDHTARLALEAGSTLTLTDNGANAIVGLFVTSTYYQSGSALELNGGTLKAGSDWGIWYTSRDKANTMPHPPYWGMDVVVGSHGGAESTIDLNGHDVGLTAGLHGLGDLTVTGDGNMRGGLHVQGRLAGNVSVSGTGVKDLSGAAAMSNLTVAAGAAVKLGVGGTNCVKMAYLDLKNVGLGKRDEGVYDNMDEAMAYDGDFPYRPTSLGLVHGQFRVANGDSVLADGSAAIYEGQFYAPTTDTYTFAGTYNNGIELKIDGARVFQSVGYDQSQSGTCELAEGWHDFRVVVMNMGSVGFGQDLGGWHDAGMGLAWTNAVVDAASISNAPTGLIRFDTDTLAMRPGAPLASTSGLVNWKRAPFAKSTEPTKEETAADYEWEVDTTTNTMVFLNKRYGTAPAGWPVANAVAEVSGWFLVPEGQGGEWMFTTCFDNSVYFWVDDEEGFFAGYNPPTTNWCHLASGWHKFKIRTADKGGAVGSTSARNGECAVRAKRPGGSLVAFDERNFALCASMDDLFDALPNGIAGDLTLGAGSVVSNVSATGGCPVRGTVSGAGTLAGQWLLTGDATLTYADVPKTVRDLGDYGPRFTDAQAALFRHGGHVTVAFAEQPVRQSIKVCPAGGLEGLSPAEIAARITCTVAGDTATWFEPVVADGWLYFNNLRAGATVLVFR